MSKSTFFEVLLAVFGEYAHESPPELFMIRKHEEHPTLFADLFGRRLVACAETQESGRINEARLKNLTGGDTIPARRMREDYWSFAPSHTLWLYGNHPPAVRGADEGVWRRLRLIPFTVRIPEAEQVPHKQLCRRLTAEAPGILSWAGPSRGSWTTRLTGSASQPRSRRPPRGTGKTWTQ